MNEAKVFPKVAKLAREGDMFMVSVPNHWGKGKTVAEAARMLRDMTGKPVGKYWRLRSVHPDTVINDYGQVEYPTGHEPVFLDESNPTN